MISCDGNFSRRPIPDSSHVAERATGAGATIIRLAPSNTGYIGLLQAHDPATPRKRRGQKGQKSQKGETGGPQNRVQIRSSLPDLPDLFCPSLGGRDSEWRSVALGHLSRCAGGTPHRSTLAPPPRIAFSTSERVAIDVSPGVVIANAPCAAPHSTAHFGPLFARNP
jgi:hypothetical protein